jgi:hypothetical protein
MLDFQITLHCAQSVLTHTDWQMEQSPSWEANQFVASQEIPRILSNLKVHCRIHNCPPPVSILSHLYPVHTPTSHVLKVHRNIIPPSKPRSPQWPPSLRLPYPKPYVFLLDILATCPVHLIILDFIIHQILGEYSSCICFFDTDVQPWFFNFPVQVFIYF